MRALAILTPDGFSQLGPRLRCERRQVWGPTDGGYIFERKLSASGSRR
jgi:hypothetical protein